MHNCADKPFMHLAELIGKITYNASNSPAPFDADSGNYIISTALQYQKEHPSDELKSELEGLFKVHLPSSNWKIVDDMLANA